MPQCIASYFWTKARKKWFHGVVYNLKNAFYAAFFLSSSRIVVYISFIFLRLFSWLFVILCFLITEQSITTLIVDAAGDLRPQQPIERRLEAWRDRDSPKAL
jgi:hypothetical protein